MVDASSSMHTAPAGQSASLAHARVHMPPGKWLVVWHCVAQSPALPHAPPTTAECAPTDGPLHAPKHNAATTRKQASCRRIDPPAYTVPAGAGAVEKKCRCC